MCPQREHSCELCLGSTNTTVLYRTCESPYRFDPEPPPEGPHTNEGHVAEGDELLHHKYHLPAHCFAYVGDSNDPRTWKLPYLLASGSPDPAHLPKAIQALLSNYRGTKVGGIPDDAIPAVFRRLEVAARTAGKMPDQQPATAPAYQQLAAVLEQIGVEQA